MFRQSVKGPETLNTLVLTEEDGKTMTVCTVLYPSKEARDKALGTGNEGRLGTDLRPSRRVPANDCVTLTGVGDVVTFADCCCYN